MRSLELGRLGPNVVWPSIKWKIIIAAILLSSYYIQSLLYVLSQMSYIMYCTISFIRNGKKNSLFIKPVPGLGGRNTPASFLVEVTF